MKWIRFVIFLFLNICATSFAQAPTPTTQLPSQASLQALLQAAQQQQQPINPQPPPAPGVPTPGTTAPTLITGGDVGVNLRDEAFANMAQTQLPMTPDQIRTLRRLYDEVQRAAAEYPGVPPRPTSSSLVVNLSPGATPPSIRLLSGFVTSLVFVDSTGAPWPIKAYDNGEPSAFNIQWDQKSNTLLVQAVTQYKPANLAVILKGLNTPVMLTLLPGQAAVDYRVDLHVPGLGPFAFPLQDGLPAPANTLLLNVLSGIPPVGSRQLLVFPQGYADVWLLDSTLYVRTRATLLSPAWISTMSSSDGTHAYKLSLVPLLIVSLNGKPVNLSLQGF
jgi:intracellular multiplication protein IcmK